MKKYFPICFIPFLSLFITSCCNNPQEKKSPVDYVNPYMGNVSHLLVPTYPTVHLPFSLLRVYPERPDYTSDQIAGLPVAVTSHRGSSAFNISPVNGTESPTQAIVKYTYDKEKVSPYRYSVYLDEKNIQVDYAPSHQSGLYAFLFEKDNSNRLVINTRDGQLEKNGNGIAGYQVIDKGQTKIYAYFETKQMPSSIEKLEQTTGKNDAYVLTFDSKQINLRYGISFISNEQAERNLRREINTYSVDEIAKAGREKWNEVLGKIEVEGADDNQKME